MSKKILENYYIYVILGYFYLLNMKMNDYGFQIVGGLKTILKVR